MMDQEAIVGRFATHEQRIVAVERDVRDLKEMVREVDKSLSRMGWMLAGTFGGVLLQLATSFITPK